MAPLKSDRLLLTDRPVQSLVWRYPEFFQMLLELKLTDETLVPGQPLDLQWRLYQAAEGVDGVAHARIFVDGQLVREHANVPISDGQQ